MILSISSNFIELKSGDFVKFYLLLKKFVLF